MSCSHTKDTDCSFDDVVALSLPLIFPFGSFLAKHRYEGCPVLPHLVHGCTLKHLEVGWLVLLQCSHGRFVDVRT